jgi:hypothetical protein
MPYVQQGDCQALWQSSAATKARTNAPQKLENLDVSGMPARIDRKLPRLQGGNLGGDACLHLLRCAYSGPMHVQALVRATVR